MEIGFWQFFNKFTGDFHVSSLFLLKE
jgi:hypothetical protein